MEHTTTLNLLALDLGAESGRAILGRLTPTGLTLEETHRFLNEPVVMGKYFYWDFPGLVREIKKGIRLGQQKAERIDGVSIDTWGVDYGLLDSHGELLGNPIHYRDRRTESIMEEFLAKGGAEIYRQTGIQMMSINTSCQLYAHQRENAEQLARAGAMLLIPGLLTYFLSGVKTNDTTIASTSQLYNPVKGDWAFELIDQLGLPRHLFAHLTRPATVVGGFAPAVRLEMGFDTQVIAGAGHDTAAAVAAVPAEETKFAYISCGTWSLIGTELPAALINEKAQALNFTNEVGICDTIRLLKNVIGLWILQQCRQSWIRQGQPYDYAELVRLAEAEKPWQAVINPDDPAFINPPDMVTALREYIQKTGQIVPETVGGLVRTILESLALKYTWVIDSIQELTGDIYPCIYMVGGGTKNEFLCRLTADVSGRRVTAGPIEATAIGNLLTQALALGKIKDLAELRRIVRASFPLMTYTPTPGNVPASEIREKFQRLNEAGIF